MSKNLLTMVSGNYVNGENGQTAEGITVIIDGQIKDIFDALIEVMSEYNGYEEVLRDAIVVGVSAMAKALPE